MIRSPQEIASAILYLTVILFAAGMVAIAQISRSTIKATLPDGATLNRTYVNPVLLVVALLPALLLTGLRQNVGSDYPNYIDLFNQFANLKSISGFFKASVDTEPAFILLNLLGNALTHNYISIFFLSAFILYCFLYKTFIYHQEHISISLAVFVFFTQFYNQTNNIMRQFIAVGIIFYAIRFIIERKPLQYFLFVLLAISFHLTAMIMLPFYFIIGYGRVSRTVQITICALLVAILIAFFTNRAIFINNPFIAGYSFYTKTTDRIGIGVLAMRLPFLAPLLFAKRLIKVDKRNEIWLFFLIVEVLCTYLGYINEVFNRIAFYFSISWVIMLPAMVEVMNSKVTRTLARIYIVAICLFFFWWNVVYNNYGTALPYHIFTF